MLIGLLGSLPLYQRLEKWLALDHQVRREARAAAAAKRISRGEGAQQGASQRPEGRGEGGASSYAETSRGGVDSRAETRRGERDASERALDEVVDCLRALRYV